MVELMLRIDDELKKKFMQKVGRGNMTEILKKFIINVVEENIDDNELLLIKEKELLEQQIKPLSERLNNIINIINSIKEKKRIEELNKVREQQKNDEEFDKKNIMMVKALKMNNPLRFRK